MSFGIAHRLALLLALFSIVVGGITGGEVYRSSRDLLVEDARTRLLTTTQVLGRRIQSISGSALRDVRRIANHQQISDLLESARSARTDAHADDLAAQFQALLSVSPEYYQVRLISAADNGMERVRVERANDGVPLRVAEDDLQEKGHFDYVRNTLALPVGGVFASDVQINREVGAHAGTDTPTLRVAAPVHGTGGKVLGLVVINLSLSGVLQALGDDLPTDLELYLTDKRGEFLVHPDPKKTFAFDRGQSALVQDQFPATKALFNGGTATVIDTVSASNGQARDVVAAFARYEPRGLSGGRFFVIGLAQSRADVLASSHTLAVRTGLVVLGFSILALFIAFPLAGALTTPLRCMAEAVGAFPARPLGDALPVHRDDELGVLARGLRAMEQSIGVQMAEVEAQRVKLHHQAHHDRLTGLPNRALFSDRFEQALARSRRSGTPVALLFLDLDGFKAINDTWGHAAGDLMLQQVAQRLRNGVREADTTARVGGDEFVVVIEGTDDLEYLTTISQKLCELIGEPVPWNEGMLRVGLSIGMACFPRDGDTVDAITSCADARMYRVKQRNSTVI
ncbi:MAG: GGDEF domain-containing protein [Rhodocyclaceae bacterium]|nr:GGDEF domain-containing protein [Rhodocyclaceae bacterium]